MPRASEVWLPHRHSCSSLFCPGKNRLPLSAPSPLPTAFSRIGSPHGLPSLSASPPAPSPPQSLKHHPPQPHSMIFCATPGPHWAPPSTQLYVRKLVPVPSPPAVYLGHPKSFDLTTTAYIECMHSSLRPPACSGSPSPLNGATAPATSRAPPHTLGSFGHPAHSSQKARSVGKAMVSSCQGPPLP